jgi:hypothetical protein
LPLWVRRDAKTLPVGSASAALFGLATFAILMGSRANAS